MFREETAFFRAAKAFGIDGPVISQVAPNHTKNLHGEVERHSQVVAHLSGIFANLLGWNKEQREGIELAGYMHDLGKYYVPATVLLKPGQLNSEELELMRQHPIFGAQQYLHLAHRNCWKMNLVVLNCILQHHERYDGEGYPFGKKNCGVDLPAQIVSLSDVLEALCADRCYRSAFDLEEAWGLVEREKGRAWPVDLVDLALANREQFDSVLRTNPNQ